MSGCKICRGQGEHFFADPAFLGPTFAVPIDRVAPLSLPPAPIRVTPCDTHPEEEEKKNAAAKLFLVLLELKSWGFVYQVW